MVGRRHRTLQFVDGAGMSIHVGKGDEESGHQSYARENSD